MLTPANVQPIYNALHTKLINNFDIGFDSKRNRTYEFTISQNHSLPFNLIISTDRHNVPTSFRLAFNNGPIGAEYIDRQQAVVNQVTDILTKQFNLTENHVIPTRTYVL